MKNFTKALLAVAIGGLLGAVCWGVTQNPNGNRDYNIEWLTDNNYNVGSVSYRTKWIHVNHLVADNATITSPTLAISNGSLSGNLVVGGILGVSGNSDLAGAVRIRGAAFLSGTNRLAGATTAGTFTTTGTFTASGAAALNGRTTAANAQITSGTLLNEVWATSTFAAGSIVKYIPVNGATSSSIVTVGGYGANPPRGVIIPTAGTGYVSFRTVYADTPTSDAYQLLNGTKTFGYHIRLAP